MEILIVTPSTSGSRSGNETTAQRWAQIFQSQGHQVGITTTWDASCDLLIALHAKKNAEVIRRFHQECPDLPLIVALTGTDVYGGMDPTTLWSVAVATRLIVLQPLALDELPDSAQDKTHVIYQSVRPEEIERSVRSPDSFDVGVIAHLRAVKDPLLTAQSARLLPDRSRVRVFQAGEALTDELRVLAETEQTENPRYSWLGSLPRLETLRLLSACDLSVNSSTIEGGANAVGESIALGVPVLASDIPGNVGLLGEDYPGYFPVGDAERLAELINRAENEPMFLDSLKARCLSKEYLFEPAKEEKALAELIDSLG